MVELDKEDQMFLEDLVNSLAIVWENCQKGLKVGDCIATLSIAQSLAYKGGEDSKNTKRSEKVLCALNKMFDWKYWSMARWAYNVVLPRGKEYDPVYVRNTLQNPEILEFLRSYDAEGHMEDYWTNISKTEH